MIASFLFFRSNDPLPLYVACILGFCLGIHLFIRGFRLLQRRRLILDTPSSKIRSASMGLVEISGQAVGPFTLISPITARPSYYYRTLVWELQQRGKNKQWVKVAGESMFVPFFLDDNTGRVLIDPRGAELELHRDFECEFSNSFFTTLNPVPGSVIAFLARKGVSTHNKIKVEECCIKPKNAMFVLGTLGENPGIEVNDKPMEDFQATGTGLHRTLPISFNFSVSSGSSSAEADVDEGKFALYMSKPVSAVPQPQVIRLTKEPAPAKSGDMTQQQRVATALMKAGISNPAAWSAAGIAAPQIKVVADPGHGGNGNGSNGGHADSQAASGVLGEFEARPAVALRKGTNDKSFLISWRSQQEVAASLGWKCTLMIWGGPVLALACLWLFLSTAHLL